jgi:hyperosmotically inducible protein
MKSILIPAILCASALVATSAFAQEQSHYARNSASDTDSSSHDDSSSPGNYVKDSLITTKVKSKLAARHLSTLTNIKVDTDEQGVVWLSGTAPNKDAKDIAAMVARDTEGVTAVHNKIVVLE